METNNGQSGAVETTKTNAITVSERKNIHTYICMYVYRAYIEKITLDTYPNRKLKCSLHVLILSVAPILKPTQMLLLRLSRSPRSVGFVFVASKVAARQVKRATGFRSRLDTVK